MGSVKGMSDTDLIKVSYEAARAEIVTRLRIRSQTLAFYLAASGILLSYIIKGGPLTELIILVALFSLAGSLMVTHQNVCISLASEFCGTQIKKYFGDVPMWNNCAVSDKDAKWRRRLRFYSQLIIILFPPMLALVLQFAVGDYSSFYSYLISKESLISIVIMLLVLAILIISKEYRRRIFNLSCNGEGSM